MKRRWKKGMAWLLSALCILVTVQIPSIPAKAEANGVQKKIEEILQQYPDGSYFSVDGKECGGACWKCQLSSIDSEAAQVMGDAWECAAFARYVFYHIFGCNHRFDGSSNGKEPITVYSVSDLNNQAKVGDLIACMDSSGGERHSGIYVGGSGNTFNLYESNVGRTNLVRYKGYDYPIQGYGWASYRIFVSGK